MSFPKIKYCIICEDARRERGNKTSLLGFYGMAPDVEIGVADIARPVDRVMFFLVGEKTVGPAAHKAKVEILDEKQTVVAEIPDLKLELPEKEQGHSILAFGFGGLVFGKIGTFTFRLSIDGSEHFKTTFRTVVATPEQLAI